MLEAGPVMLVQCGAGTETVCCELGSGVALDSCQADTAALLYNAKESLVFRINQLENFDKRYKRNLQSVKAPSAIQHTIFFAYSKKYLNKMQYF